MTTDRRRFLAGIGVMAVLPGCLEAVAELAPPPLPDTPPDHYAARRDGAFTIPAVNTAEIPDWLHRQVVRHATDAAPGTIEIASQNALLYFVLSDGYALRYGISVGREGLGWTGEAEVYRTARWPSWTPTPTMIRRDPSLQRWAGGRPGGPSNPLGARALYLKTTATGVDEGIRIHGTPEWRSIGRRASSGCFRMLHQDVIDLYGRAPIGTRVVVT